MNKNLPVSPQQIMQSFTDEKFPVKNSDSDLVVKSEVFVSDENVNFEFDPPTNIADIIVQQSAIKCDPEGHMPESADLQIDEIKTEYQYLGVTQKDTDNTKSVEKSPVSWLKDNEYILPDLETEEIANKIKKEKGSQFKCQLCPKSYSSRNSLKSHRFLVHSKGNSRQYSCSVCGKIFTQSAHRSRHMKEFHREPESQRLVYKCEMCGRSLTRLESLKFHKRFHCPGKQIDKRAEFTENIILEDEFILPDKVEEKVDEKSNEKTNGIKCDYCPNYYATLNTLRAHLFRIHSKRNSRQYSCPICSKVFTSTTCKTRHVKTVHRERGTKNDDLKCKLCSKTFSRLDILKKHDCTKKKEKIPEYLCKICNEGFTVKRVLEAHMKKLHTEKKKITRPKPNLKCDFCKKKFSSTSGKNRHMREVHLSGEKTTQFACDKCGTLFKRGGSLQMHHKLKRCPSTKVNLSIN